MYINKKLIGLIDELSDSIFTSIDGELTEGQKRKAKELKEAYLRERKELECLAYVEPTEKNRMIISRTKNIDILKEWLTRGFDLERFRVLENSDVNMKIALESEKIRNIDIKQYKNMSKDLEKWIKQVTSIHNATVEDTVRALNDAIDLI